MGLLKIHHRASGRRLENPTYSLFDKESNHVTSFHILIDVDETLAGGSAPSLKPLQRQSKSTRKRGSSFALVRRQATEIYNSTLTISTPTSYTYFPSTTEITTPSSSPTPTDTTDTQTQRGQAPISSPVVQLILGVLASLFFICLLIRCFRVGHQYRVSSVAARQQRNLGDATAMAALHASALRRETRGTRLVPTNEMTLAGRLNLYQARTGVTISPYPYGQEPLGAAEESGLPLDSVNPFVAPAYGCDVSPPPFMTNAGKPPSYFEVVGPPARAPTLSNPAPSDPLQET
ncbi:hypothetical protein BGX21_005042 [Mortierella sp. AD011]|nr:hypothetical protein BGX20_004950 [Mortierella sp. AD010]KAF9371662.1 hypothetical protein BGX21_005042 [Mortierella sp. AD011]